MHDIHTESLEFRGYGTNLVKRFPECIWQVSIRGQERVEESVEERMSGVAAADEEDLVDGDGERAIDANLDTAFVLKHHIHAASIYSITINVPARVTSAVPLHFVQAAARSALFPGPGAFRS
jgi:hypothetical protein